MKFLAHKSLTVIPQTRFFGSVPKRQRKGQCASKEMTRLRMGSEASKVHIQLRSGPILSDTEVSCPKKSKGEKILHLKVGVCTSRASPKDL